MQKHNKEVHRKRLAFASNTIYYFDVSKHVCNYVNIQSMLASTYKVCLRDRQKYNKEVQQKRLAFASKIIYYLDVFEFACLCYNICRFAYLVLLSRDILKKLSHSISNREHFLESLIICQQDISLRKHYKSSSYWRKLRARLASIKTHIFTFFTSLLILLLIVTYNRY